MMKKILSVFLSVIMIFSMFGSVSIGADEYAPSFVVSFDNTMREYDLNLRLVALGCNEANDIVCSKYIDVFVTPYSQTMAEITFDDGYYIDHVKFFVLDGYAPVCEPYICMLDSYDGNYNVYFDCSSFSEGYAGEAEILDITSDYKYLVVDARVPEEKYVFTSLYNEENIAYMDLSVAESDLMRYEIPVYNTSGGSYILRVGNTEQYVNILSEDQYYTYLNELRAAVEEKNVEYAANILNEMRSVLAYADYFEDMYEVASIACENGFYTVEEINSAIALCILNQYITDVDIDVIYKTLGITSEAFYDYYCRYENKEKIDFLMYGQNFCSLWQMRECFNEQVFLNSLNNVVYWGEFEELLYLAQDFLDLDLHMYERCSNKPKVLRELVCCEFKSIEEFEWVLRDIINEMENSSSRPSSGNFGGGGSAEDTGDGSEENPYKIYEKEDLIEISLEPSACYVLRNDLEFTEADYVDGGILSGGWQTIAEFSGKLDGAGHSISGLKGTNGGFVNSNIGEITNIRFLNHNLSGSETFGSIANENSGIISKCYVYFDMTEENTQPAEISGGIAGINNGTISHSFVEGNIFFKGPEYKYCFVWAGGIAAKSAGTIESCYNNAYLEIYSPYVTEYVYVGGMTSTGSVSNCRNDGKIYVDAAMDYDIYATAFGGSDYTSSYCYGKLSCGASNWKLNRYTNPIFYVCYNPDELSNGTHLLEETFEGFDFESKWMITANGPMPQGIMNADGNCYVKNNYVAPTCVTNGYSEYLNSNGGIFTEDLEAIGHLYSDDGERCTRLGCDENVITEITFDMTEAELYEGKTLQLKVSYSPESATDTTITWSSSDETVANVSENGYVEAISAGKAEIRAESVNGVSAVCSLLVLPIEDKYPESEHNYANNMDEWMSYTYYDDEVTALTVKFSEMSMLESCDYVEIYDAGGNLAYTYYGDEVSGAEITVKGNSLKIHMVTDVSVNYYGFSIDSITPSYEYIPMESLWFNVEMYDGFQLIGNAYNISCSVYPENTTSYLIWSSSDESVASVENGVLTVNGYGSAEITATSSDGVCSHTEYICVHAPVYINADNIELNVGESFKLDMVITSNIEYTQTWYSQDTDVATVDDDGTVHAVGPGSTNVHNGYVGCHVYVSENLESPSIVSPYSPYILQAGKSYKLPVRGLYEGEYVWGYSYDDSIAEYDSSTHTIIAKNEGETTIEHSYGSTRIRVVKLYEKCVFTVEDGIITKYDGDVTNMVIPEEIDGERIVGIGNRAFSRSSIETLEIPSSIEKIDNYAFSSCYSLKEIIINEGVREIADNAFWNVNANVIYNGSKESLINLNIGEYNDCIYPALRIEIYLADELYMIANAVNNKISNQSNKTFVLMNDISLNNAEWVPIGLYSYDDAFKGNFYGNGYTVSDFVITENYDFITGFFGNVYYGEIRDFNISNAVINMQKANEKINSWTGILAGWIYRTDVSNCSVNGTIYEWVDGIENNIGGFVGRISDATIENCYADTVIKVYEESNKGQVFVGGFAGYMYGTLNSCKSTSDILYKGKSDYVHIGGLLGHQAQDSTSVTGCTSNGTVNVKYTGTEAIDVGGLIGWNRKEASYNESNVDVIYASSTPINVGELFGNNADGTSVENTSSGYLAETIFVTNVYVGFTETSQVNVSGVSSGNGVVELDIIYEDEVIESYKFDVTKGEFLLAEKVPFNLNGEYIAVVRAYGEVLAKERFYYEASCEHETIIDEPCEPTCINSGLTEGRHCSVCGEVFVAQEEIPALGHNEVIDKAVEPTETESGLTEGIHCSACGEILVEQLIIPPTGVIEPKTEIILSSVKAEASDIITVEIDIANNSGFTNLGIEIDYDNSVMTLKSIKEVEGVGADLTTAQSYGAKPYNMIWNTTDNTYYNGKLATLTFEINQDAKVGVYPITVDYYKGRNGNYTDGEDVNYDENEKPLNISYNSGNLIVVTHTPGDINDDGKINNHDGTALLRYLAGWELIDINEEALDVNGDGRVNNHDGTALLRYLAGWDIEIY